MKRQRDYTTKQILEYHVAALNSIKTIIDDTGHNERANNKAKSNDDELTPVESIINEYSLGEILKIVSNTLELNETKEKRNG